jgi:hypothetical protein
VLLRQLLDAEEPEETADLLADAVRLAVAVDDRATATSLTIRAELVTEGLEAPGRRAVAPALSRPARA